MTKLTKCPKDSTEGKTRNRMCHSPATNALLAEKAEHALTGTDNTCGEKRGQSCQFKFSSELEALPEGFLGHHKYLKRSN